MKCQNQVSRASASTTLHVFMGIRGLNATVIEGFLVTKGVTRTRIEIQLLKGDLM